jgi:hypothetical protein
MAEKKYRVVQNEGKISWRIEELWEGGVTRSPYGNKVSAINAAERIATENGYINDLVLEEVGEEKTLPTDAFDKDAEGNYTCLKGCSVEIANKEIVFNQGMKFTRGNLYMGVDVVGYLDEKL